MLDLRQIRENPDEIRKNLERRRDPELIKNLEMLLKADEDWRIILKDADLLKKRRNEISREINEAKKSKKDTKKLFEEAKKLPQKIKDANAKKEKLEEKIKHALMRIPNLLHESVPYGKDDSENVEVKTWGKKPIFNFPLQHHGQLAVNLGIADFERAVKISGSGFYFLQGELAQMDLAIQHLAIDMLLKKGYQLIIPPYLMRRKPYEGVTSLADFEEVMYKIENEDLYLIATSEHPMAAMYMGEIFESKELPIKLAGLSQCFRQEIGKHGLDERGLFRVHQFSKIEQFIFCKPEESETFHKELLKNSEDLMQKLEIPYRVVNTCTGDMGSVANKKYDVEGWSPREEKYIELMSCSNCTDYQANRLKIRYRKSADEKISVHTLNNTMVATARMMRLILENYQTKEGTLNVPKALQPYMGGLKEIKPQK